MARVLTGVAVLALTGCFTAPQYSSDRTVARWRATSTPAAAEPAPGVAEGRALGAEETYALALHNSPQLAALEAQAEVADARAGQARQLDNPQLRFQNIDVEDIAAGNSWVDVAVRVPIPRPGSLRAQAEAAKMVAASERSLGEEAKRQLRARIDKRFAVLATLRADLEQVTAARELAERRRAVQAERLDNAAATKLDAALADATLAEAAAEEARIAAEIEAMEGDLRRLAGEPREFRTEPLPAVGRAALDRDKLVEAALRNRPELPAAHAGVAEAQARAHLARNRAWPWFEWGQADYFIRPDSTPRSWGFGVALTLPVFSWNRGEIKATRALVRQREAEQDSEIAAIAAEVDAAAGQVERTAERLRRLRTEVQPRLQEVAEEARAAHASGALDPIEANTMARKAVRGERLVIAAELEHRLAIIELESAIGARLPGKGRW